MALRRTSLSTGDIARHCQVTPATVVNWIKAEKLKVYTTPGGQYRMELPDFLTFLQDNRFPVPPELAPGNDRRILIVEGDPTSLQRTTDKLSQILPQAMIEASGDGYEALIKIGAFAPHAVVLDLMMPRIDGAEVCRRLRAGTDTRHIFLVAVSGLAADNELARRVKRIGVDAFLPRPLDVPELARQLGRLLRLVPAGVSAVP